MDSSALEIWKDVVDYKGLYKVSTRGNVLSMHTGKILKPWKRSFKRYYAVKLYKDKIPKTIYVHQLMAQSFLGHIVDGHSVVVNHKDNTNRNDIDNLEVITHRENVYTHHKGTSKYKGVSVRGDTGKFVAQIQLDGKRIYREEFSDEISAHLAYESKLKQLLN